MRLYSIESNLVLDKTNKGEATASGEHFVELSDEEVAVLVGLIKEKGTTNVDRLELQESHPGTYDTLEEAYRNMAYDEVETEMLWDGYCSGYFEYNDYELKDYCKEHCGFKFEYNDEDYDFDEDEEEYKQECIEEDETEYFKEEWLPKYLQSLSANEANAFFYNHMNACVDIDDLDYTVNIPQAIINMASNTDA